MPASNSTVRKRRRGEFVYPSDAGRTAKYAARESPEEEATGAIAETAEAVAAAEATAGAAAAMEATAGAAAGAVAAAEDQGMEVDAEAGIQLTQMLELSMAMDVDEDDLTMDQEGGKDC